MTLAEAADILGLSPTTLRVQIRNGRLRATKRGRDWHVTPAEVERYRAQRLSERKRTRCTARHPWNDARCEDVADHGDLHHHRLTRRTWSDDPDHPAYVPPGSTASEYGH